MAILRKNQHLWLGKGIESRIFYDVRYTGPAYNRTAFFAAIPQNQSAVSGIEGITSIPTVKGQRNEAYGFMDATEQGAIDKLEKHMKADYNAGIRKEKLIFIDNDNDSKSPFHRTNDSDKTKRTVTFEYIVAVKVTRNNTVKYFELNEHGVEKTSEKIIYEKDTMVPWTPEREAACKGILELFDLLQQRVNEMVKTDAIGLLDKNIGLLLAPGQ